MKKRYVAMILVALLLPGMALAAESTPTPAPTMQVLGTGTREAYGLLDEVAYAASAEEAVALILKAADAAGDDAQLVADCARMLFYLDTTGLYASECEALLRRALELAEGEARYDLTQLLSEQLIMMGRAEEAKAMVAEAMEAAPDNDTLKIALASSMYYEGKGAEALDILEELLEDSPRNFEARKLYAAILLDEYRWEDALQAYRQMEEQWPEYLDGLYGQFLTYIASGEFDRGTRLLDILLNSGADDSLWYERARIRLWLEYLPEEALAETDALLRMNPEWIEVLGLRVGALAMLGRTEEAAQAAEEIGVLDVLQGEIMMAAVDMDQGAWQQAEKRLNTLVGEVPVFAAAWRNLSTVRLSGYDDAPGATRALAKAFMVSGDAAGVDMYIQLGDIRRREGDLEEAARAYQTANSLVWDDPAALSQLVLIYIDAGNKAGALEALEDMEKVYPGWYETMVARMLYEDTCGNAEAALAVFEAAKKKFPYPTSQLTAYETMLRVRTGELDAEAVQATLKPAGSDAEDPGAWDAYAYSLMLVEDLDAAQEALDTFASLIPETDGTNDGAVRSMRLSQLNIAMEISLRRGDMDACIETLTEAVGLGWPLRMMAFDPLYEELRETQGYKDLLASLPSLEEPWDLTVAPTIPQ